MKLSKVDKLILESYCSMMDILSGYLGSAYELSLHSLEDYRRSVIKICNGYHSGRSVGAPLTDLALNMLKRIEIEEPDVEKSYTSYMAISKTGDHLKSSTIPIYGENHRLIGFLCINLYLDTPLTEILQSLNGMQTDSIKNEFFAQSTGDMFVEVISEAKTQVYFDSTIAPANKNREIIRILFDKGIFNMKDAVVKVAEILGISKNTVYLHLRGLSQKE